MPAWATLLSEVYRQELEQPTSQVYLPWTLTNTKPGGSDILSSLLSCQIISVWRLDFCIKAPLVASIIVRGEGDEWLGGAIHLPAHPSPPGTSPGDSISTSGLAGSSAGPKRNSRSLGSPKGLCHSYRFPPSEAMDLKGNDVQTPCNVPHNARPVH